MIQSNNSVIFLPVSLSISLRISIWTSPLIPPPSKVRIRLPPSMSKSSWEAPSGDADRNLEISCCCIAIANASSGTIEDSSKRLCIWFSSSRFILSADFSLFVWSNSFLFSSLKWLSSGAGALNSSSLHSLQSLHSMERGEEEHPTSSLISSPRSHPTETRRGTRASCRFWMAMSNGVMSKSFMALMLAPNAMRALAQRSSPCCGWSKQ